MTRRLRALLGALCLLGALGAAAADPQAEGDWVDGVLPA